MKQDKLEFDILVNGIREDERKYKKAKREEAIAAGASCLSCKHTKTATGNRLRCSLKSKYVLQYNYCEQWIVCTPESKEKEK